MEDEYDYRLYVLAELKYRKAFPNTDEKDLFPQDWYSISSYKLKNEIIAEAIKEGVLIGNTSRYQKRLIHVRTS